MKESAERTPAVQYASKLKNDTVVYAQDFGENYIFVCLL